MSRLSERRLHHRHEVMSWAIAADLLACHRHLRVANLHPGDGQYDVLAVRDDRTNEWLEVCEMNRGGSIHVRDMNRVSWPKRITNVQSTVEAIAETSGLQRSKRPSTRPAPHVARFISTALRRGGVDWRCLPVFHDSSGMFDSGIDSPVLDGFDATRRKFDQHEPSYSIKDPIYGWFALTTGDRFSDGFASHMLICLNGEAWLPHAREPEATRPDWPTCGEHLLRDLGLV